MAEGPCRPRRWPRVNLVGMEAPVVRAQGVSHVGKGGAGVGLQSTPHFPFPGRMRGEGGHHRPGHCALNCPLWGTEGAPPHSAASLGPHTITPPTPWPGASFPTSARASCLPLPGDPAQSSLPSYPSSIVCPPRHPSFLTVVALA